MTIQLVHRFGDTLISGADGERTRDEIATQLEAGRPVALDFGGVRLIISAFLNPAIAGLYERFAADLVDRDVTSLNESPLQRSRFEAAKERGKRYYNDAEARKRRDAAIEDLLAG